MKLLKNDSLVAKLVGNFINARVFLRLSKAKMVITQVSFHRCHSENGEQYILVMHYSIVANLDNSGQHIGGERNKVTRNV